MPPRSQRKQLLQLPDELLAAQAERFPATFDRNVVLALFALRSLAQRINDYTNETLAPFGLNAAKYNYLIVLSFSPDAELTLNELSRLIHTSNATVTSMVNALERDGLVRRRANERDRRSSVVRLTAKGRKLIEKVAPIHQTHNLAAMSGLSTAEREELLRLLLDVGAGFERHFAARP